MKFALALCNCWGFCQRKSVFSLMCAGKLLPRQNGLHNIYVDCVFLSYHIRFQSESTLYSCLNVKELLAWSRCEIWNLSNCNCTRTQNHLVHKWTLNHLDKWLSVHLWTKRFWVRVQLQRFMLIFWIKYHKKYYYLIFRCFLSKLTQLPLSIIKEKN